MAKVRPATDACRRKSKHRDGSESPEEARSSKKKKKAKNKSKSRRKSSKL